MLRFCGYRHPRTGPFLAGPVLQTSGHRTSVTMVMEPGTAGTADADLCSRICALQETPAATIPLEISSRKARAQALQQWWDYLRPGLDLILYQRGADMVDGPGRASGFLPRDFKGKKAGREVYRIDPGVVSLVAELRGHKRRAAKESGQWKTRVEESQGTHGTAHQPRSVD